MAFNPFKSFNKKSADQIAHPVEHISEEIRKKATPPRGSGGKFVSTKKSEKKPETGTTKKNQTAPAMEEPVITSFYGVDIRKIYHDGKWYFSTQDILALAKPTSAGSEVKINPDYEGALKELSTTIKSVTYANSKNSMQLVHKMEASFPGPLSRWLNELSQLPYIPKQPQSVEENLIN